jgi:hypothetical protein
VSKPTICPVCLVTFKAGVHWKTMLQLISKLGSDYKIKRTHIQCVGSLIADRNGSVYSGKFFKEQQ